MANLVELRKRDNDTPHFDSKLESLTFSYDAKFFLNQRMISEGHIISKGNL